MQYSKNSDSKVKLWVVTAKVDIDKEKFLNTILSHSDNSNETIARLHADILCPVYSKEPVERLEIWDPNDNVVKILLKSPLILSELEPLYKKLKEKYGTPIAKRKVVALSWKKFLIENYAKGARFLRKVHEVEAKEKEINLDELHPLLRCWVADFLGLKIKEERTSLSTQSVKKPLIELSKTKEIERAAEILEPESINPEIHTPSPMSSSQELQRILRNQDGSPLLKPN